MFIFDEVRHFRDAIDIAKEEGEFRTIYPFINFPNDCCDHACDLLGQYLLERGIITHQVNCVSKYDESWHHVWLETSDEILIDITGDQFIGRISQLNENPKAVYVGEKGQIHKIFCKNKKIEPNTNFTDKNEFTSFNRQPNPRQKTLIQLYEIISRYL
ncbi:hypothetical protein [Longibaculum muris]|uniref:hypothetical protein n=1 Tax=Longibaculum muris TaxID=1796628 RepID=UPI0022E3D867|nr:hypothetical protein [Longibaculum muris]